MKFQAHNIQKRFLLAWSFQVKLSVKRRGKATGLIKKLNKRLAINTLSKWKMKLLQSRRMKQLKKEEDSLVKYFRLRKLIRGMQKVVKSEKDLKRKLKRAVEWRKSR